MDRFPAQKRAILEGNAEYRQVVKSGLVGIHEAGSYHTLRHHQTETGRGGCLALQEMVRVLRPGGALLIANLNSFFVSCPHGWLKDPEERYLHYRVDRYLEEFPEWVEWFGVRIDNSSPDRSLHAGAPHARAHADVLR
ncbi:MAG: hypothetical protein J2P50_02785 [Hyphomicrobiaceae bacterium]|nr:hypothetical protein [Hyphomicrobiaceae bacterium]